MSPQGLLFSPNLIFVSPPSFCSPNFTPPPQTASDCCLCFVAHPLPVGSESGCSELFTWTMSGSPISLLITHLVTIFELISHFSVFMLLIIESPFLG